jgi:elongation factor Ts
MGISAAQVKELREKTGAGMMDCKAALQETGGDVEKAVDHLRKEGILKAAKRAERATGQGLIASYVHAGSKLAVLVEINHLHGTGSGVRQAREYRRQDRGRQDREILL